MDTRWKRFMAFFLVLALATLAFTACNGDDEEDAGLGEPDTGVVDEGDVLEEDTDLLEEDTDLLEEDTDLGEETDVVEDEGLFGDADIGDDDLLDENEFSTFLTENEFEGDQALAFDQYDENDDLYLDETEFNDFLTESQFDETTGFGLTGDEFLTTDEAAVDEAVTDETAAGALADVPGFMTSDTFVGLTLVNPSDIVLGEVVDAFFDMNGDIQYLAVDIEEEAVVELETLLGDETLFDEEVDVILISQNLIDAQATADLFEADFGPIEADEPLQMTVENPARLVLLEDAAAVEIPWVAQEIDAAALGAGESFFADPTAFGMEDQFGPSDLLQVTTFEFWEGTDNAVETIDGEEVGDIDELIIDFLNGEVAYVTVDTGGFLGLSDVNNAVIPWGALLYETENNDFLLDVDPALIETTPTLADEELDAGFIDSSLFTEDVDPFWENEI